MKRLGYSRAFADMGELTCAMEEAKYGDRPAGYVLQPDVRYGEMTRKRVQRLRRERMVASIRHLALMVVVYGGSLVVVVLLVGAVYEFLLRFVG